MADESMRERMLRKQRQIADARGKYWKPKEGENYIRICPSWKGANDDFHYETPTHYQLGPNRRTLPCLAQWGEVCPACRRAEQLASSTNVEDQKRASQLMPKVRVIVNVLPNNDPDGTIKLWSITPDVFGDFLSYYTNTGWGDFTHPKTGYNFTFTLKDKGKKLPDGRPYLEPDIIPDKESTRFGKPVKGWSELLKLLFNIETEIAKNRVSRADFIKVMRGEEIER